MDGKGTMDREIVIFALTTGATCATVPGSLTQIDDISMLAE